MNFMSDGAPKMIKTRKPRSVYALNLMSNGAPKMMGVRSMRCPVGKAMGPKGRCLKKKCPAGKMINPLTGRCINKPVAKGPKKCPPGKMLSAKGRCVGGPGSRKTYALNFMVNGRPLRM